MLTTLPTLKLRLAIPDADTTNDALLTSALKALSARFDKETNRTLARTAAFVQEFDIDDTQVVAACYPIESVTKFETKTSEATGWTEVTPAPEYLIRQSCIISLPSPVSYLQSPTPHALARVVFSAGYVLPGTTPAPGQTPLPDDIEQAAVEQIAFWFQNRDHLGLKTFWPSGDAYRQFAALDLLDPVRSVLSHYRRFQL